MKNIHLVFEGSVWNQIAGNDVPVPRIGETIVTYDQLEEVVYKAVVTGIKYLYPGDGKCRVQVSTTEPETMKKGES